MQATAEVLSRPGVKSHAERFNFKQYMVNRAELVNGALDAAVPLQYPEAVVESMRYAVGSMLRQFALFLCGLSIHAHCMLQKAVSAEHVTL